MFNVSSKVVAVFLVLAPATGHAKKASKRPAPPVAQASDDSTAVATGEAAPAAPPVEAVPAAPPVVETHAEPSDDVERKRLGIGYKLGNGLGFVGGDVILNVVDHLSVDVQLNSLSAGVDDGRTATGYGVGGEAQLYLKAGQVSSPFLALGVARAHLSLDDVTGSATGYYANLGYEFRWQSGIGVLLGAGGGYLGSIHGQSPTTSIDLPGGAYFNLEAGFRYMIF